MKSNNNIFCFNVLGLLISLSSFVNGHRHIHHQTLDNVKYSYGIFAPIGWTVGAYTWYITSLGLILGAILLLYFSKGWTSGALRTGIFDRGTYSYQRAFGESGIFDRLDESLGTDGNHTLFWADRISGIAQKFEA